MNTLRNKANREKSLSLLLAGIDKHKDKLASVTLGGAVYTADALKKLVQADLDTSHAADLVKAQWLSAVQLERNEHQKVDPILRLFKSYVVSLLGDAQDSSGALADFGLTPRKRPVMSVDAKSVAAAKSKATRAARHTMGSVQKKAVKGTVPLVSTDGGVHAPAPAPSPATTGPAKSPS